MVFRNFSHTTGMQQEKYYALLCTQHVFQMGVFSRIIVTETPQKNNNQLPWGGGQCFVYN